MEYSVNFVPLKRNFRHPRQNYYRYIVIEIYLLIIAFYIIIRHILLLLASLYYYYAQHILLLGMDYYY